jgi:ligand-binding sensor domain-containing protein
MASSPSAEDRGRRPDKSKGFVADRDPCRNTTDRRCGGGTLALCAGLLLFIVATSARAQAPNTREQGPRYTRVDSKIVRLQVIDGTDVRFSRVSQTKGISQTRVTAIVQDQRGFMWFATQYGLNRYDGYSLKQFKHQDSDPRSVSDSYVTNLLIDHMGQLWVGSRLVVDRYDPTTENFIHYPLEPGRRSEPAAAPYHPNHVSEGPDGSLWISTGAGLFRLDPATGLTVGFHHRPSDPASLSSELIESSAVDRRGTLWVASPEGLDAFDPSTQRVTLHVPIREPREMSFYEDRSGTFWILHSSGDGLAVLDRDSGVLTEYSFARHSPNPDELTGVSSMIEDADGQLWIGTQSDGLLRLDASRRQVIRYRNDPFNSESLAENRITTLARDREGEIWVGLGASEPNHFSPHPSPFQALPFDVGNPDNLGERLVNVLYEDSAGALWVGTTGALNRYDRAARRYEHISVRWQSSRSSRVYCGWARPGRGSRALILLSRRRRCTATARVMPQASATTL